jgi:hypothetical protein
LDTTYHYTYTDLRLLDQAKYSDAQREFDLAVQLDPKYSKAYTGIALVKTYIGDFHDAWGNLKKAGNMPVPIMKNFSFMSAVFVTIRQVRQNQNGSISLSMNLTMPFLSIQNMPPHIISW